MESRVTPADASSPAVQAVAPLDAPSAPPTGRLTNLSRRASFNAAASGTDYVTRTVVEFALTPILLQGLGSALYGTWRVLWRLTGYLWAASGRSAVALQSAVANRLHSDDVDEKRRLVAASVIVWVIYLPVLAALTAIATWIVPDILEVPANHVGAVRWAIVLLGADAMALSLLSVPYSVLQGENLGYKRMGLSAVLLLVGGGITAAMVWLGFGIVGVAAANLLGTVFSGVLWWRVTRTYVPWFGMARPKQREVRSFLGLSSWFMVWKLVNQMMISGDILVLGALASVQLVSVYSLSKYVPDAVLPLVVMLMMGGIPGLGGIIGAGHLARARGVRTEMMSLTWLVTVTAGATILIWNHSFVTLWVGEQYYAGDVELLLIMATLLQLGLIRNDAFIIDLTLKVRAKVLVGMVSAVGSLALAAVLIRRYDAGITGLCVGLITGRAILTVLYPWMVGKAIDHPLRQQLRGVLRPAAVTAVMFAGATWAGRTLSAGSWFELVGASLVTALAAALCTSFVGLSSRTRSRLVARARAIGRSTASDTPAPAAT